MVVRANYPRNEFDPNGDYTADQAWRLLTYNWTDSERRRQPLDGRRPRRRRRPHRALEELEHRRRSRPELRRVRDGQGRVHPLHVPPGRLEHASVVRPRPGGTHGGRHLPRPAAQRKDEGDSGHALQDPDRLLRQRRLAVGDHDPGRGRCVHGDDERPGRRSVRHVRRRGRPERRRREHRRARLGRPSARQPRRTRTASSPASSTSVARTRRRASPTCSTTTAPSSAPTTGRGGRSQATGASTTSTSPTSRLRARVFLSDTTWDDAAPYTDLDTLVFGPSANSYQLVSGSAPFGAPYILDTVGASARALSRARARGRSTPPRAAPRTS